MIKTAECRCLLSWSKPRARDRDDSHEAFVCFRCYTCFIRWMKRRRRRRKRRRRGKRIIFRGEKKNEHRCERERFEKASRDVRMSSSDFNWISFFDCSTLHRSLDELILQLKGLSSDSAQLGKKDFHSLLYSLHLRNLPALYSTTVPPRTTVLPVQQYPAEATATFPPNPSN